MNRFSQASVSGLMSGACFTHLGIEMVLTYRTARVSNCAHEEPFVIGIGTAVLIGVGVSYLLAILAESVIAVILDASVQWFVPRPRSDWLPGALILITLGAVFVVRAVKLVKPSPGLILIITQSLGERLAKLKARYTMLVVEQSHHFIERLTDCAGPCRMVVCAKTRKGSRNDAVDSKRHAGRISRQDRRI